MDARITNIAHLVPDVLPALQALSAAGEGTGIPAEVVGLAQLRASQVNGCSVCLEGHWRSMRQAGTSEERLAAVAAWRDSPHFSEGERAALALAESVSRLADRPDPVPDPVWDAAAAHFDERQLAGLVIGIAVINVWNRFNVSTRQPAGQRW